MRRPLLIDGDSWREAINMVNIGLLHFVQKLTGIGGQRLNVPALTFSKYSIEGKAAFARTRKPGDNNKFVTGYDNIDVFQIMLAGATNNNVVLRHTVESPILQTCSPQVVHKFRRNVFA